MGAPPVPAHEPPPPPAPALLPPALLSEWDAELNARYRAMLRLPPPPHDEAPAATGAILDGGEETPRRFAQGQSISCGLRHVKLRSRKMLCTTYVWSQFLRPPVTAV